MNQEKLSRFFFYLGIVLLILTFILQISEHTTNVFAMAVVAFVIASWWIFEVLPLAVTALLPVAVYPVLGILSVKETASVYMSSVLMLFIGGFFIALAMRRWNLHKRIALSIVSLFGNRPENLISGFMVATAILSMWISNTATTDMMVSIALAVIKNYEDLYEVNEKSRLFASALMLSIAYSATIGGMATLVGTPPNIAFVRIFSLSFPELPEVSFGQWISFGLPMVLLILWLAQKVIIKLMINGKGLIEIDDVVIRAEKEKLGTIKYEEKCIFFIFTTLALAWIFRSDLNLGFVTIKGWSNLFEKPDYIDDGAVAIFMAITLFMIPAKTDPGKRKILEAGAITEIPWHTIILFGGGFALAKGIQESGLSLFIGQKLIYLQDINSSLIIVLLTTGMSFLTELASNMASTEMALPILAAIAKATNLSPYSLMIPATLAASSAFMLPAATAPNAIIFGSERVSIKDMVKVGFWINLINIIVISIVSIFIIPSLL